MKIILVTGSTDGIGRETARQLLELKHKVLVHGRNEAKARSTAEALGGDVLPVWGDFAIMADVRAMAEQVKAAVSHLDVLINNAGTIQPERRMSADGFEMTMAVNHFAPMLLTLLLKDWLAKSPEPRIITVSSGVHTWAELNLSDLSLEREWSRTGAYASSKLANVLFAAELPDVPGFEKMLSVSVHPGVIRTKLLTTAWNGSGAPVSQGARNSVYCATAPGLEKFNGEFIVNEHPAQPNALAGDRSFRRKFWQRSIELLTAAHAL